MSGTQNLLTRATGEASEEAITSRKMLERAFWTVASLIGVYVLAKLDVEHPLVAITGLAVLICALAPAYLWCSGKIAGWPLLPTMSATYVVTFALPMLSGNPSVTAYPPEAVVQAGVTAVAFLLLSATTGAIVLYRHTPMPKSVLMVRSSIGTTWFLRLLAISCVYQIIYTAGWPSRFLPGGVDSVLNAAAFTLINVGAALLASRLGARQLTTPQKRAFAIIIFVVMAAQLATLLLISTILLGFIMIASFTLARGRPPVRTILAVVVTLSFFHIGKHEMRDKSWDETQSLDPWNIPSRIFEWAKTSTEQISSGLDERESAPSSPETQSLSERASLIQQTLVVQSMTPDPLPYLFGETYAIIPSLLVPRVFWPEKPVAHEGTTIINVYYGRQTREQTTMTTIGVGLMSEAFANFGYFGVAGLAVFLGWFYGFAARWSADAPLHSFRGLVALMLLGAAIQTEHTMGVVVSSLFQGFVAIVVIAAVSMRRYPVGAAGLGALGTGAPEDEPEPGEQADGAVTAPAGTPAPST